MESIHVLQCDVRVTKDEWVTPDALYHYVIAGMGGSDLSPALVQLAEDPEVHAVLVLTDGYISFPDYPMPYDVLWALMDEHDLPRRLPVLRGALRHAAKAVRLVNDLRGHHLGVSRAKVG